MLVRGVSVASKSSFRIGSAVALVGACVGLLAIGQDEALAQAGGQPNIQIGSVVNLKNQYPSEGGYLDTRGRTRDKSEFSKITFLPPESVFVSTHPNPDRSMGSGSWQIMSASGKAAGAPLEFGDKIHLRNMYADARVPRHDWLHQGLRRLQELRGREAGRVHVEDPDAR